MARRVGLTLILFLMLAVPSLAQLPVRVTNPGPQSTNTPETIGCGGGTSPCTIGGTATNVLNATPNRKSCILQNANVTDFYCKKATAAASGASTTNFDFILKAA